MDKRAWVHQLKQQVEKQGADRASWYVSWTDPAGKQQRKSCGPGKVGKSAANKLADSIHSQLVCGTYEAKERRTWVDFRKDYETKIAARFDVLSRTAARQSLDAFERVAKPKLVAAITADVVDKFTADRMKDAGIMGRKVSPATVNRDLRYIRLVLNIAHEWGLIARVPRIRFLKQPQKLPTYMPSDHFAAVYTACNVAQEPSAVPNVTTADWWRALLVTAYMTGWRISQLLSLKWSDIDLEANTAITRAEVVGNKGKRDERIPLHPVAVEHLKRLAGSFSTHVFPWNQDRRQLWPEFHRIQEAATLADGSPMPKGGKNGWYGFHDLRRGFATMNAASMDLFELQALMQHKTLATTQGYVSMSKRLQKPVNNLFVPSIPQIGETA